MPTYLGYLLFLFILDLPMRGRDKSFGNYGSDNYDTSCYNNCFGSSCRRCSYPAPVSRCPECAEDSSHNCYSACKFDCNCQRQTCRQRDDVEPCLNCQNCNCIPAVPVAQNPSNDSCKNCSNPNDCSSCNLTSSEVNEIPTPASEINATVKDDYRNCSCKCAMPPADNCHGNCSQPPPDVITVASCTCNCTRPEVEHFYENDDGVDAAEVGDDTAEGDNLIKADTTTYVSVNTSSWDSSTTNSSTVDNSRLEKSSLDDDSMLDDQALGNPTELNSKMSR